MQLVKNQLIEQLEQANQYLAQRKDREPNYQNLIDQLQQIAVNLHQKKPVIKIVSNSAQLANRLKQISEANPKLRSLYTWQILSAKQNIKEVIKHCELVCFIYDPHKAIAHIDKPLIKDYLVAPIILVTDNSSQIEKNQTLSNWLVETGIDPINNVLLPLDDYFDLNSELDISQYAQYLTNLSNIADNKLFNRLIRQTKYKINQYFSTEKSAIWQGINQQKNLYTNGERFDIFKQKINQTSQKLNQEQQQKFKKIKQKINQLRMELTNPFVSTSLIYFIQQAIEKSSVKLVQEDRENYLYLVVQEQNYTTSFHSYLVDICHNNLNNLLKQQWHQIDTAYGDGGLKNLLDTTTQELQIVNHLYEGEIKLLQGDRPSFNIAKTVCISTLKNGNRIIFDYHFTQSSWFKLFVSTLFGIAIYLVSKLLTGTGRFFGFFVLIFQVINIFTGHDVKSLKLKQQSKELKRVINTKSQALVRLLVERFIQDLIINLDNENQRYKQQIEVIVTAANLKLDEIKHTVEEQKARIDNLKKDQEQILSFFES